MAHDTVDAHGLEPYNMILVDPSTRADFLPPRRKQKAAGNFREVLGQMPKLTVRRLGQIVAKSRRDQSGAPRLTPKHLGKTRPLTSSAS